MNIARRIRLFLIGVLLGSIIMYFFVFKDRNVYKSPSEVIHEKLQHSKLTFSNKSTCEMNCNAITSAEIQEFLKKSDVNFGASQVHQKPCPIYVMEGKSTSGKDLTVSYQQCDSSVEIISVALNPKIKEPCPCN